MQTNKYDHLYSTNLIDFVASQTTQGRELEQHCPRAGRACVLLAACPRHFMLYAIAQVHLNTRKIHK